MESEGGLYHVINRRSHRADVFGTEEAKGAFEKALGEVVDHWDWRRPAYSSK